MPGDTATLSATSLAALTTAKRLAYSLDDVRAVDYGYVHEDGKPTDRIGVRFHMTRKRRLNALAKDQRLPNEIDGVEVDVLVAGYAPHSGSPRGPQDVLQPGISVGNRKQGTTGTLGVLVRDLSTNQVGFVSNWHVLCGGPEAAANDEICQPGPMDMRDGRVVASLDRWLRLSEHFDAALARLAPGVQTSDRLFGTEVDPRGTAQPVLGMRLLKSGSVSGVTHARVDGIGGSFRLDYTGFGDGPQWMDGFRLVPDPDGASSVLSQEGDSGALWIDAADGHAVGLHFAGEDDMSPLSQYALAHPIIDVLQRMNVTLSLP